MPDADRDDREERRGDREVDAVPLRMLEAGAEDRTGERANVPAQPEERAERRVVDEVAMPAAEMADAHRERLVGEDVAEPEALDERRTREVRAQRRGHEQMAQVDEQHTCCDLERARALAQETDRGELRGAGEHEQARAARLNDREAGLPRDDAVGDPDDDAREQDRPALRDGGACGRHESKGTRAGVVRWYVA